MTVSSLGAVAAGIERAQQTRNPQINNTITALVREPVDLVAIAPSSPTQSDFVALRDASVNLAQTQATVQVAQNATINMGELISRAAALANTSAGTNISDSQRVALNQAFQAVRADISSITASTNVNGQNLLDGTFSAQGAGIQLSEGAQLAFPVLTDGALFGGQDINIASQGGAIAAQQAVANARAELSSAQAQLNALQSALEFAQANVTTALQNRDAARAAIADIDLAVLNANSVQALVANNPSGAVIAQANNLPANALEILS